MTHEYVISLEQAVAADTGAPCLRVHVRTVREFASFGYRLGLEVARTDDRISIEIGGLELPEMTMQRSGPARSFVDLPIPQDGTYQVVVLRKGAVARFSMQLLGGEPVQPAAPIDGEFVTYEAHG